jgi:hypothetical protein
MITPVGPLLPVSLPDGQTNPAVAPRDKSTNAPQAPSPTRASSQPAASDTLPVGASAAPTKVEAAPPPVDVVPDVPDLRGLTLYVDPDSGTPVAIVHDEVTGQVLEQDPSERRLQQLADLRREENVAGVGGAVEPRVSLKV